MPTAVEPLRRGHLSAVVLSGMSTTEIRVIGDPVLRTRATEVIEVTGALGQLIEDMLATMYDAPGIGLAAPQVGVQKRIFVYDWGEGPSVVVNPRIEGSDGEWVYEEGCLSIPGLSWEILRPKEVPLVGFGLDGNEVHRVTLQSIAPNSKYHRTGNCYTVGR